MALAHCQKFRAQLAAAYNPRRLMERPIPSLNPAEESDEHTDDEMSQNNDSSLANENESESDDDVSVAASAENYVNDGDLFQNNEIDLDNGPNQIMTQNDDGNLANENESERDDDVSVAAFDATENSAVDIYSVQNDESNLANENESERDDDVSVAAENVVNDGDSFQNYEIDLNNGPNEINEGATGSNDEIKHTLHNVLLDLNDEIAINALFDDESSHPDENSD